MKNENTKGYAAAWVTVLIWGTTFISTKILLAEFRPIEILFFRFVMGLAALKLVYPKHMRFQGIRQELLFAAAGLTGVCLYYLLENIALTYTSASNVGVIVSVSPFFMAVLSHIFLKEEKLNKLFFAGFFTALIGICLISFQDAELKLNPVGDVLAVLAAFVWAVYSLITKKIGSFGYNTIQSTKRIFTYGILFMIPALFLFDFRIHIVTSAANPVWLLNLVFLGLGASALCFMTWNYAVNRLGTVRTGVCIYMVPVITVVTSAVVLQERLTLKILLGVALTMAGLFLSEMRR